MNRIEMNVTTGERKVIDLTTDEIAALNARVVPASELNAPILAKIAVLDLKRIRPLAEGDTVFLAKLNDQVKALRAQLK